MSSKLRSSNASYVIAALLILFVVKFLFLTSYDIPTADQAKTATTKSAVSSKVDSLKSKITSTLDDSIVEETAAEDTGVSARPKRDDFDAFADYKYQDVCKISSLDLHRPFEPLCKDKTSLIDAMSNGGRIGIDAPYMPRDCDMRWYTTQEACSIVEKFDRISIIGDSMMRQMLGALYVILRKNMGYGGVTDWNFSDEEKRDCFCNAQNNVKSCSVQTIYNSKDIYKWDPESFACDPSKVNLIMSLQVKYPQEAEELTRFEENLANIPDGKKAAFVFGQGLWNDLDVQAALNYLDTTQSSIRKVLGSEYDKNFNRFPRLFMTPNAAGFKKQDAFILTQGNKPLMLFEYSMKDVLPQRNFDVIGTWNMSIQSTSYDGVHCDLKGNLLKAMMFLNWLDAVADAE
ncbi:uncharacterized protein V1510DRAFT_120992 [Dipodascopsis tothii]|uniref:uncharacterized protein n=1 Tax=Dipodascopsis tothii TaxID=44089 RepID=UPI0034CD3AFC